MRCAFLLAACLALPVFANCAMAGVRDVTLTTADGVVIRATLGMPRELPDKAPGVILIHQGGSNRHEWDSLIAPLLDQGYVVLAYDVRGHGESDAVDSIRRLFNDPQQAPLDLQAAIAFLQTLHEVDAERLAVVGASIGANLAAMASSQMAVRTAVAISGKTSAVYNLAGTSNLAMRSVFFISSDGDQGGKRAAWAAELYDRTGEPRRLEIIRHSSRHGVGIFEERPEVRSMLLEWLRDTL